MIRQATALLAVALAAAACGRSATATAGSSSTTTVTTGGSVNGVVPAMYEQFYGVTVSADGSDVVLRATSVPDHPSPYFTADSPLYEAPQPGMTLNPFHIVRQDLVFHVPATPRITSPSDTPLGPIGVAVNGVAFFNQYAAGRSPLGPEIQSFDRYDGHPQMTGLYHYHREPFWLTAKGSSRLLGVLLDGFPVYGTRDAGGAAPTDLDVCNGHVAPTAEFPSGIYHYHVTSDSPYISGCFRGQAGRVG